jgi:anti-anti-sigma regulatory factor
LFAPLKLDLRNSTSTQTARELYRGRLRWGGSCTLALTIHRLSASLLRDALADADRREVRNVLVDLSRVNFLALVGIQILRAAGERRAAAHRRLVVVAPTSTVQRVLSLVDVTGELEVYVFTPSARSALAR